MVREMIVSVPNISPIASSSQGLVFPSLKILEPFKTFEVLLISSISPGAIPDSEIFDDRRLAGS